MHPKKGHMMIERQAITLTSAWQLLINALCGIEIHEQLNRIGPIAPPWRLF